MRKLLTGPVGKLVAVLAFVLTYFELRLTETVPDEPLGWMLCFFSALAIVHLTPLACEQWLQFRSARRVK